MSGSSNWNSNGNRPKGSSKLASGVATILIFTVLGTFGVGLFFNVLFYWKACSNSFPLSGIGDIAFKTFTSAVSQTIQDFGKNFWNFPIFATGCAAVITGVRVDKPSFHFVGLTWVVSSLIVVIVDNFSGNIPQSALQFVTSFLIGALVALLCWLFSRLFWS